MYIHNIEEKFGSFHYAKKFTRPTVDNFEKHLDEMIPGFRSPSNDLNGGQPANEISEHDVFTHEFQNDDFAINDAGSSSRSSSSSSSSFGEKTVNSEKSADGFLEQKSHVENPINLKKSVNFETMVEDTWEFISTLQNENETCKAEIQDLKTKLQEAQWKIEKQRQNHSNELRLAKLESAQELRHQRLKQWCHVCLREIDMEHKPTCLECSLK